MKRSLSTDLALATLGTLTLTTGGCVYAYHEPGQGTQLAVGPPPVIAVEAPPVYYAPAPVYYGPPPVSLNFGFGGYWGGHHGHGHGHWHH